MRSEANKTLTLKFFDDWFSGRLDDALALASDDFTFTVPGNPEQFSLAGTYDKQGWAEMLARIGTVMPDGVDADILQCLADGEHVVVVAHTFGTSWTGRRYDNDLCYVLQIREGLVASCREYLDTIHANEVLAEGV